MDGYGEKSEFFDQVAPDWENGRFTEEQRRWAEWIVRRAGIRPGMTVLEPGCGAGRMTRLLSEAVGPRGKVVAVDISERMIAAARRNAAAPNVRLHHLPVEELRLPAGSVDVVLCFDVFPHFEEPGLFLERARDMLRPGGTVVIAHCPGRTSVNETHARAGGAVGADRLPEGSEMGELLRRHGLVPGEIVDLQEVYYVDAQKEAVEAP